MDISPSEMMKALSISAFCGFSVSFLCDIVAIITFEILSRKRRAVIFVLDTIFIVAFTVILILLLYYLCDGRVRGALLFAMLLGAFLYRRIVRKTANKMIMLLIAPIKILIGFFALVLKKIIKFLLQAIAKIRIKLYNKGVK